MTDRNRSAYTAHESLRTRAKRVSELHRFSRDVLWRAAWLRTTFGMGLDESLERAQAEVTKLDRGE